MKHIIQLTVTKEEGVLPFSSEYVTLLVSRLGFGRRCGFYPDDNSLMCQRQFAR